MVHDRDTNQRVGREPVIGCPKARLTDSVGERLPEWSKSYAAFVDPSGGTNDT